MVGFNEALKTRSNMVLLDFGDGRWKRPFEACVRGGRHLEHVSSTSRRHRYPRPAKQGTSPEAFCAFDVIAIVIAHAKKYNPSEDFSR